MTTNAAPRTLYRAAWTCAFASAWTLVTGSLSVLIGLAIGSIALVGAGADVLTDVIASGFLVYRFTAQARTGDYDHGRELVAQKIAATALLVVAAGIGLGVALHFILGTPVGASRPAIVLAIIGTTARPTFALMKYHFAKSVGSKALRHDALVMGIGGGMSAATLLSLAMTNWGMPWADSIVALSFALVALRQGVAGWRHVRAETRQVPWALQDWSYEVAKAEARSLELCPCGLTAKSGKQTCGEVDHLFLPVGVRLFEPCHGEGCPRLVTAGVSFCCVLCLGGYGHVEECLGVPSQVA